MRRIRLTEPPKDDETVTLASSEARYVARVLRLRVGDEVVAFDGYGQEWHLRLTAVAPACVEGQVIAAVADSAAAPLPLILGQALPKKSANMDLIVEKCSELGLTTLVPLYTERTVVREAPGRLETKLARWRRVAEAAARQCGRRVLLDIQAPQSVSDFCEAHRAVPTKLVAWEEERRCGIRDALEQLTSTGPVVALIGPEGGLTEPEVADARANGFVTVSLGPRILRTETAAITLVSLIRYAQGEFDPAGPRG